MPSFKFTNIKKLYDEYTFLCNETPEKRAKIDKIFDKTFKSIGWDEMINDMSKEKE
jgi:hypothetical protein